MKRAPFVPGFRFSVVDGFVLLGGVAGAIVLSMFVWWQGFVLGFVIAHFFFFCNVVRMARPLELLWGGVFVALAGATIAIDTPGCQLQIGDVLHIFTFCLRSWFDYDSCLTCQDSHD